MGPRDPAHAVISRGRASIAVVHSSSKRAENGIDLDLIWIAEDECDGC